MYEYEFNDFLNKKFENHRYSTYLSFTFKIPISAVSILNTASYQSLITDFVGYRILEQLKVNVKITEVLSMFVLFDYYYDGRTPRERTQFSTQSSIELVLTQWEYCSS